MTPHTDTQEPKELAHRASDGIEVWLFWHGADVLTVRVLDTKLGIELELTAPADRALDVYYHPFAYVGSEPLEAAVVL
jgi:hypothetical protein